VHIQISVEKPEAMVEAKAPKFYVEKVPESAQRAKKQIDVVVNNKGWSRVLCRGH
jgi:hypothetical protein